MTKVQRGPNEFADPDGEGGNPGPGKPREERSNMGWYILAGLVGVILIAAIA